MRRVRRKAVTQVTRCKLCRQELPAPFDEPELGAVVNCTCGALFVRMSSSVKPWREPARAAASAGKGGNLAISWATIVRDHNGPDHVLRRIEGRA